MQEPNKSKLFNFYFIIIFSVENIPILINIRTEHKHNITPLLCGK